MTSWEKRWLEIPINLAASRWVIPACTRTRAVWRDFSFSY
ncbi:hypothetical protein HMPREF0577_0067 [Mobiluncus mulieris ATCC 35243]|nr:hypothetical protein HMPREF0577_0067 [Mobiluncus mulieris ATCC 35243]